MRMVGRNEQMNLGMELLGQKLMILNRRNKSREQELQQQD